MASKILTFFIASVVSCVSSTTTASDTIQEPESMQLDSSIVERVKAIESGHGVDTSKVQALIESDAYRKKVDGYISRTTDSMGLQRSSQKHKLFQKSGDSFVLFVSSTVPMATLRNYAKDLHKIGGYMVLRGMVGDETKIKPTLDFIRRVIVVDENCTQIGCDTLPLKVAIDPDRFSHFKIESVPAGIIEHKPSFEPNCDKSRRYDEMTPIVYGDASIQSMLHVMTDSRAKASAEQFITLLEQ